MELEVTCPNPRCGEVVRVVYEDENPRTLTEPSGRVSISANGMTFHQCPEGTYDPESN